MCIRLETKQDFTNARCVQPANLKAQLGVHCDGDCAGDLEDDYRVSKLGRKSRPIPQLSDCSWLEVLVRKEWNYITQPRFVLFCFVLFCFVSFRFFVSFRLVQFN